MRNRSIRTTVEAVSRVVLALALCSLAAAPAWAEPSGTLTILHAGSLSVPFAAMEKAFEAQYPGVDVVREAGGSTKMARLISEQGRPADIMASADYVVIDKNLIPGFASWNARFATNQLVLCYTDTSRGADEVTPDNWFEILQDPEVSWGHSDPNLDPCGYRSLMVLQLAEIFYGKPGLARQMLANRPAKNVRPKAKELVAMLKSGELDYGWEYLSVAVQHGLRYVLLDKHVNLSSYRMDPFYALAKVEVTGKEPGSIITRTGRSITYGVTMLDKAPNPEAAEAFLAFLLSPDNGLATLREMGQPPLTPPTVPTSAMHNALPGSLKPLVHVAK